MDALHCSEHCLRVWEILGTWIAGIGSLAAVYVAIRLASWDQKIHLRVSAHIGLKINFPGVKSDERFLWVQVTNIGRRPAMLRNVCVRTGLFSHSSPFLPKRHAVLIFNDHGSTALPTVLQDGQSANFWMPLAKAQETLPEMMDRPYWLAALLFRVFTEDAASGVRFGTVSKDLRARLLAATRAKAERAKVAPG